MVPFLLSLGMNRTRPLTRVYECFCMCFSLLDDLNMQVYVTMYLNDCQRTDFYEGIGLTTKEFDMHVIIEVNVTTKYFLASFMGGDCEYYLCVDEPHDC